MKRWEFERAVLASELPAPARLILLTLSVVANWPGGYVPAEYGPSLTGLADRTGLSRRAVAGHLNEIEKVTERDGWVVRSRPTKENARSKKERTHYQLSIPASARPALALVPNARVSSARGALASAGDAPELVQEMHRASAPGAHNQVSSSTSSSSSATPTARIAVALGAEEEEARQIYDRVISERKPTAPSRYIDALITSGDIAQFRGPAAKPAAANAGHPYEDSGRGYCARCMQPEKHARHGGTK